MRSKLHIPIVRSLVAITLLLGSLCGQERQVKVINDLVEEMRSKHGVPAMAALALDSEGIRAQGVAGVRADGFDVAATRSDRWHLGSCTKALTATLVAVAVDKKKLTFETTLKEAFPDTDIHEDLSKVTVEQLLAHRSGLQGNPEGLTWARMWTTSKSSREARLDAVKKMLSKPLRHAPGSRYLYSNAGYMMVGAILEQRFDESWEVLVAREVFKPLGITSAGFGAPGSKDKSNPQQPWGHRKVGKGWKAVVPGPKADNPRALGPAGICHMTIQDWGRFGRLHLRALNGKPAIVSKESFARLHTPKKDWSYVGGWGVASPAWAKGTVYSHAGSNTMWYCSIHLLPKSDRAVLVATNAGPPAGQKACNDLAKKLATF